MKLRLVLNKECPLNCVYCYKEGIFSDRKNLLNYKDLNFIIKEARKSGFDEIKFTGGEPTLYKNLFSLIETSNKEGYLEKRMTTNGLALGNFDYCKSLKKSGLDGVTVSVNSFNKEIYEKMVGKGRDTYKKMMQGLNNAIKVFGSTVILNTVLTKYNFSDIPNLVEFAKEKGLGVKILDMLDEEKKASSIYVSLSKIKKAMGWKNPSYKNAIEEIFKFNDAHISLRNSCCGRKECDICREGYHVVRITTDGKLKTCIAKEDSKDEKNAFDIIKKRDSVKLRKVLSNLAKKFIIPE